MTNMRRVWGLHRHSTGLATFLFLHGLCNHGFTLSHIPGLVGNGRATRRLPNRVIPFRFGAKLLWIILSTLGSITHPSRLFTNLHGIHDLTKDAGASGSMKQSQQLTHFLFLHGVRMKLQVRKSKFTHTQALLRRNVHSHSRDSSCLPESKHFLHSRSGLSKTAPQPASVISSARLAVRRQ